MRLLRFFNQHPVNRKSFETVFRKNILKKIFFFKCVLGD
jgi:hypothetical protein